MNRSEAQPAAGAPAGHNEALAFAVPPSDLLGGRASRAFCQRCRKPYAYFLLKTKGVKLNESEWLKITARRCTGCGLLKLYARPTSD